VDHTQGSHPTDPSMMRNYEGVNTINKRQHEIYQRSKKIMIQVYGREGYFNTNLQTLHATDKLKPHHRYFTVMIHELFKTYKKFIYDFLPVRKNARLPEWYTLSATEIEKIRDILKIIKDHKNQKELIVVVFAFKIIHILYQNHNGYPPQEVKEIINRHKEFFNQFKNLLNL